MRFFVVIPGAIERAKEHLQHVPIVSSSVNNITEEVSDDQKGGEVDLQCDSVLF